MGAAIIQNKQSIAYWSRLLQPTQQKYTTTEKELLAIILCLKEYEKILYGAKEIKVFTDHKNLTFNTLSVKGFCHGVPILINLELISVILKERRMF